MKQNLQPILKIVTNSINKEEGLHYKHIAFT